MINSSLQERRKWRDTRSKSESVGMAQILFRKCQLFFSGYIKYVDFFYSCRGWWFQGEELGLLSSNQEFSSFWSRQKLEEFAVIENWKPKRVTRKAFPWVDSFSLKLLFGGGEATKTLLSEICGATSGGQNLGKNNTSNLSKNKNLKEPILKDAGWTIAGAQTEK